MAEILFSFRSMSPYGLSFSVMTDSKPHKEIKLTEPDIGAIVSQSIQSVFSNCNINLIKFLSLQLLNSFIPLDNITNF